MPNTQGTDQRAIARDTHKLIRGIAASMGGKQRGRDREVRRNSYDVDDPRAKPWRPIGSVGEGLAHREALLQVANEQRLQHWREYPRQKVREARQERDEIAAELAQGEAAAPAGRAAALRVQLGKLDKVLEAARTAIRKIDVTILAALIARVDFATGRLFPSLDTIAADSGCHRNSVIDALKRLRRHGFVQWVRRSIATGNEGQFAPQREQTSNAYFFDHRASMPGRVWQRFIQVLTAKLRRLGKVPPALQGPPPAPPGPVGEDSGLRAALAALGALVPNAST